MIDAAIVLRSLVGERLATVTRGVPNTVLEVIGDEAVVGTSRSPTGRRVAIAEVQAAVDRLGNGEILAIDPQSGPASIGFRSSFIGAVLLSWLLQDGAAVASLAQWSSGSAQRNPLNMKVRCRRVALC